MTAERHSWWLRCSSSSKPSLKSKHGINFHKCDPEPWLLSVSSNFAYRVGTGNLSWVGTSTGSSNEIDYWGFFAFLSLVFLGASRYFDHRGLPSGDPTFPLSNFKSTHLSNLQTLSCALSWWGWCLSINAQKVAYSDFYYHGLVFPVLVLHINRIL